MKLEIPILMSTPMVKAIMDGIKTMTRRLTGLKEINKNPDTWKFESVTMVSSKDNTGSLVFNFVTAGCKCASMSVKCPYGKPGSLLWVRETWMEHQGKIYYKADNEKPFGYSVSFKPSIHMKKTDARIWLEVVDIRVERLHDILYPSFKDDAINEGVQVFGSLNMPGFSFQKLWISINGQESWDANPWVWVVKFRVLSTRGKGIWSPFRFARGKLSAPEWTNEAEFLKDNSLNQSNESK